MADKGERTRQRVLDEALELFREQGFDQTSMRDIAQAAELSLGAAYYYFASKEALVHAYYELVQQAHEDALDGALPGTAGVRARLSAILSTKLDLLERDRRFLGALFRFAAEPDHPLCVFGAATREIRERSIAVHALALEGATVPGPLRGPLGTALWGLHLGMILHALHDRSPHLAKTRALAELASELAGKALGLLALPLVGPTVFEAVARITAALGAPGPASHQRSKQRRTA